MTVKSSWLKRMRELEREAIRKDYETNNFSMQELCIKYQRAIQFVFHAIHNTEPRNNKNKPIDPTPPADESVDKL